MWGLTIAEKFPYKTTGNRLQGRNFRRSVLTTALPGRGPINFCLIFWVSFPSVQELYCQMKLLEELPFLLDLAWGPAFCSLWNTLQNINKMFLKCFVLLYVLRDIQ
ncbi:hypothetical protein AVEN_248864-1 [Araneus ventricosus]|uniref:Uncharacterized protein n=1 Tax=Araneus ventricosus TaxID=182803 RepID=A0A4Y2SCD9_ARAVE|nr:hypothetical protein AVEN_248864-1 [Araneus ventricosus]